MAKSSVRVNQATQDTFQLLERMNFQEDQIAQKLSQEIGGLSQDLIVTFMRAWKEDLSAALKALQDKEMAYVHEQSNDQMALEHRDKVYQEAQNKERKIYRFLKNVGGKETLKAYAFSVSQATSPNELLSRLQYSADLLKRSEEIFSDVLGNEVPAKELAEQLEEVRKPLEEAIQRLARERENSKESLKVRDQALKHWHKIYRSTKAMLKGLFLRANIDES